MRVQYCTSKTITTTTLIIRLLKVIIGKGKSSINLFSNKASADCIGYRQNQLKIKIFNSTHKLKKKKLKRRKYFFLDQILKILSSPNSILFARWTERNSNFENFPPFKNLSFNHKPFNLLSSFQCEF